MFHNDNQPSTSHSTIDIHDIDEEKETTPFDKTIDLDVTLQPENTSYSILWNKTITGNLNKIPNHQDLTLAEENNEYHSPNPNELINSILLPTTLVGIEDQFESNSCSSRKSVLDKTYKNNTRKRKQNLNARQDIKSKRLKIPENHNI